MKRWREDRTSTKKAGGCEMMEEGHKKWRAGKKGTKRQESPREFRGDR